MVDKSFLCSHSLFGGLTEKEIERIREFMKEESYAPGDEVICEGAVGDRIYFICQGSVEVLKQTKAASRKGKRRIATLGEGDTFGEMELIDIQPNVATVRALEETSVLTLSNGDLYRISKWNLKTFTLLIMNLAREISRRLRRMDDLLANCLYARQKEDTNN